MLTIAKIFGKSPFSPLQIHMEKVSHCVELLPDLFRAMEKKEKDKIQEIALKISKKEHEADLTKNDIRNHLPKSIFLPIDKSAFLEILAIQDTFADRAEDIAVISTLKILENYADMQPDFTIFYTKNIEAFQLASLVIKEFDSLLESSFGGIEAEKVKEMIEKLAFLEHELDILGYNLLKKLYGYGDTMPYTTFHLWQTLLKEVNDLSNIAEKLGNRIRMILELK
jgi:uncharacterized protein